MRRVRRLPALLAGLLWVVVPVVAAVLLLLQADEITRASTDESTWVPVGPAVTTVDTQVTLALTWAGQSPLVAPAWSGLVERVDAVPGSVLGSGDVVARVGGVDRLLVSSTVPFGRPLQLDDVGPDVEALNEVLGTLGYPSGRGDVFRAATQTGVHDLGERLGLDTVIFDPGWFVYSPSPTVTVATVDLVLAAPAPPPGTPIATPRPVLLQAASTGGPPGAGIVVLGDQEVASIGADGTIDLTALAAVVDPSAASVDVVVRQALPGGARQVPADSVVTATDGGTCVLGRSGPGGEIEPQSVTVVGSRLGVTTVTGLGEIVDVLVDPGAEQRSTC
jgi:hypothetical protein